MREEGLVVLEVIHLEQRGGSLAGAGVKMGVSTRVKAVRVEIVAHRLDYFVAHADDGVLALAAQPQVAVVHQKVGAMLLGVMGYGRFPERAAPLPGSPGPSRSRGRALFGADFAGDDDEDSWVRF